MSEICSPALSLEPEDPELGTGMAATAVARAKTASKVLECILIVV
jgi:hypothetical protein